MIQIKIYIIKMPILPKASYRSNADPCQNTSGIFKVTRKTSSKKIIELYDSN